MKDATPRKAFAAQHRAMSLCSEFRAMCSLIAAFEKADDLP
jgi:hypothetical protein